MSEREWCSQLDMCQECQAPTCEWRVFDECAECDSRSAWECAECRASYVPDAVLNQ